MGETMFLDGPEGKPSQAVHVIWAGQKVKEHYPVAAPVLQQARDIDGKSVVDLIELLKMKLVSHRRKDQVHVLDMISVGLVDESWVSDTQHPPHALQEGKHISRHSTVHSQYDAAGIVCRCGAGSHSKTTDLTYRICPTYYLRFSSAELQCEIWANGLFNTADSVPCKR